MPCRVPLIVAVLAVVALSHAGSTALSQDKPDAEALSRRVMESEAQVGEIQTRLETLYLAVKTDFDLLRSNRWRLVADPFLAAVGKRPETLGDDAKALADEFAAAKLLTEVVARRLAAAVSERASGLARGESMTPEEFIEHAAAAVFPDESFEKCWDEKFTDLPLVASWREANAELAKRRKALADATAGPETSPDAPPGMVLIPDGRYSWGPWTGWDLELKKNKAQRVRIQPYYIDVHEVTNATYHRFLKAMRKKVREGYLAHGFTLDKAGEPVMPKGKGREPARGMTWPAANACATFLGKRLPTEEEWEVAARGVKGGKFPWGDEFGKGVANTKEAGHGGPLPVGSMKGDVSPFGVHDMGGNVSEMTATLVDRRPVKGKLGTEHSFAYRGGSFVDGEEAALISYRWTIRAVGEPIAGVGFRCVITRKDWKRK